MRKRTSKRRWKARIWHYRWVPWSAIVEHRLQNLCQWERDFERDLARFLIYSSTTYTSIPLNYLVTKDCFE